LSFSNAEADAPGRAPIVTVAAWLHTYHAIYFASARAITRSEVGAQSMKKQKSDPPVQHIDTNQ